MAADGFVTGPPSFMRPSYSSFCSRRATSTHYVPPLLLGRRSAGRSAKASGLFSVRCEADYYAQLGVAKGADADEIKKAFRAKARKLHPDVNKAPDAIKQFQEIQQAYEVLSDPQKKSMYDQFGEAGVKGAGGFGGGGSGFSDFGDFSPFGDIFDTFFGGGGPSGAGGRSRRNQGPQQGDDLRIDLEIDFTKAIFGGDEKIRISHLETCDTCQVNKMVLLCVFTT
jgi:DnaJ-class molecular chaperone